MRHSEKISLKKLDVVVHVGPVRRQWWKRELQKRIPNANIFLWDEDQHDYEKDCIDFAVVWNPPQGGLKQFSNLKAIICVGAGVSHLFTDKDFPKNVPVYRTVGEELVQRMKEYVCQHVLCVHRQFLSVLEVSQSSTWEQFVVPTAKHFHVGVMGYGNLGEPVTKALNFLGYSVRALRKTRKENDPSFVFSHENADDFFAGLDVVVSLLPETKDTQNILERSAFRLMKKGGWVINAGRGSQLNEGDLIKAIKENMLGGAVLDVFSDEPLPKEHKLWSVKNVIITCHSASAIDPAIGGEIIGDKIVRLSEGLTVGDLVDSEQGY